jgi:hypothetical protein
MGDGSAEQILRSISDGTYRDFSRDRESTHQSVLIAAHNQRTAALLERFNRVFSGRHGLGAKVLGSESYFRANAAYEGLTVTISRRFGEVEADLTDAFTGASMHFYNCHGDAPQLTMHRLIVDKGANPEAMLIYLEEGVAARSERKNRGFVPI